MAAFRQLRATALTCFVALLHVANGSIALSGANLDKVARILNSGHALGGLLLGAQDLVTIKTSLGRISDEVHTILGVLDDTPLGSAAPEVAVPDGELLNTIGAGTHAEQVIARGSPGIADDDQKAESILQASADMKDTAQGLGSNSVRQPEQRQTNTEQVEADQLDGQDVQHASSLSETLLAALGPDSRLHRLWLTWWAHAWTIGEMALWIGMFLLDIGVVVGMMVFLESVGGNKRKSNILSKKTARKELAKQSAAAAAAPGTPIPAPTATAGRESSQWLAWLSQEEFLAACLTEHWFKLVLGLGLAVGGRLPQYLLDKDGLVFHMIINISVTLRGISLAMLFIRDDILFPKKEDVAREAEALAHASAPDSTELRQRNVQTTTS